MAALVPSRSLHSCSCSTASFPPRESSALTPGAAYWYARAQPVPPRPAGLVVRCVWGLAAFREAAPLARVHPPPLHRTLLPPQRFSPMLPLRPRGAHCSVTLHSPLRAPPKFPSCLSSASPPPQWVSCLRGRPCTLIGAGEN